ncbi:hypothetical protein H1V43_28745, partial [Streptomyces sp. PSKA54]|nr:hypothetical protein [Streptomyces himalayensis subsp. himalayensis]MBA4865268.1 hypothetical protein [Streptomyces himalayensis subsp. aureolus]
ALLLCGGAAVTALTLLFLRETHGDSLGGPADSHSHTPAKEDVLS